MENIYKDMFSYIVENMTGIQVLEYKGLSEMLTEEVCINPSIDFGKIQTVDQNSKKNQYSRKNHLRDKSKHGYHLPRRWENQDVLSGDFKYRKRESKDVEDTLGVEDILTPVALRQVEEAMEYAINKAYYSSKEKNLWSLALWVENKAKVWQDSQYEVYNQILDMGFMPFINEDLMKFLFDEAYKASYKGIMDDIRHKAKAEVHKMNQLLDYLG